MNLDKATLVVQLITAKVEILKLKSNAYVWACETPEDVKEELENVLIDINNGIKPLKPGK